MSFGKEIFKDIETFSKLECKLYGVFGLNNNIIRYIDYNRAATRIQSRVRTRRQRKKYLRDLYDTMGGD